MARPCAQGAWGSAGPRPRPGQGTGFQGRTGPLNPLYSVCITSQGNDRAIQASLGSLFANIDGRFEVVIADNGGGKARGDYLESLNDAGKIKQVPTFGASRGMGREIAHLSAQGDYELSCIDTDDILKPDSILPLTDVYHDRCEGKFLVSRQLSIAPRALIDELGGYADINRGEDTHLWVRAWKAGKYVDFLGYDVVMERAQDVRGLLGKVKSRYGWARDKYRFGVDAGKLYSPDGGLNKASVILFAAKVGAKLKGSLPESMKLTTGDYARFLNEREEGLLRIQGKSGR